MVICFLTQIVIIHPLRFILPQQVGQVLPLAQPQKVFHGTGLTGPCLAQLAAISTQNDATAMLCSPPLNNQMPVSASQNSLLSVVDRSVSRCQLCSLLLCSPNVVCTQGVSIYVRPVQLRLPGKFCFTSFLHYMNLHCVTRIVDVIYNCTHCLGTIVL